MYFNKVLSTFSLALLSLGPLNSLPVYAMEDPDATAAAPAAAHSPFQRTPVKLLDLPVELLDLIAGYLPPSDLKNLSETCRSFSGVARDLRMKNFSFSMRTIQPADADKFDLFLQRHSQCKDLKISDLNWDFLSASLVRLKAQDSDFSFSCLESLVLEKNAITPQMLHEMNQTFFSMMPQLKTLNLKRNHIGPIGAQHLAQSPYMHKLIPGRTLQY